MPLEDRKFPQWGDSGEAPPDGQMYEGGDTYNSEYVDYLWNNLHLLEEDIIEKFNSGLDAQTYKGNDIDSNADACVDCANFARDANASQFKGNDIDTNADGIVDEADEVVHYRQTCTLPKTELRPNDANAQEVFVPDGYELIYYRWGIEPDGANPTVPSGLHVEATNINEGVSAFRRSERFGEIAEGDLDFYAETGPAKIRMQINNNTDSTHIASGYVVYELRSV